MDDKHQNQDENSQVDQKNKIDKYKEETVEDILPAGSLRAQVMSSIAQTMSKPSSEPSQESQKASEDSPEPELEEPLPEPEEETAMEDEPATRSLQNAKREKMKTRKKEDSMVRKIVMIVVLVLIACMLFFGFTFYRYVKTGLEPLDSNKKTMVQVEIPIGSSNKKIGSILEKDKVIKSGMVFSYYVKMNNLTDFRGGFYQMSPNMTLDEVAKLLQQGGTAEPEELADAKIQIPEGYTIDQIGDLLAEKTKFSKEEFLALMKDEAFFTEMVGKYPELLESAATAEGVRYRLEGYLFPATYNYYKENTLQQTVEKMIATTNGVLTNYYAQIKENNLTVHSVLTLASLVEKEGVTEIDRQKIAQVFFNRVNVDMPLQSDISVLYALNQHKVHLSNKDTQVDSPYNLYVHTGYGPGPFNNPSEEAISAVLNPDINTSEIYFLADIETAQVYYAKTLEEHLALKKEHIDDKMD